MRFDAGRLNQKEPDRGQHQVFKYAKNANGQGCVTIPGFYPYALKEGMVQYEAEYRHESIADVSSYYSGVTLQGTQDEIRYWVQHYPTHGERYLRAVDSHRCSWWHHYLVDQQCLGS